MKSYLKTYNITIFCLYGRKYGYGHYSRIKSLTTKFSNKINLITFGDRIKKNEKKFKNYKNYNDINSFINKNFKIKKKSLAILDISNENIIKQSKINIFYKKILKLYNKIIIIDSINNESLFKKIKKKVDCLIIPYQISNLYKKKYKNINLITFPNIFFCDEKLLNSKKNITKKINSCLISLGSTDNLNINLKLLNIVKTKIYSNVKFTIILGKFLKTNYKNMLKKKFKNKKNIIIKEFNSNFDRYLKKNDLIISSSGITKYEALILKKPNIRIYKDKNEKKLDTEFSKIQNLRGFIFDSEIKLFNNYLKKLFFSQIFYTNILKKNYKMLIGLKIKKINTIDARI